MNKAVAWALSVVFHPLLMPTFVFAVLLYYLPVSLVTLPTDSRWVVLAYVFLATFLLPAAGTYLLYRTGKVQSLSLTDRADRAVPLFLTVVCYALVSFLFHRQEVVGPLFFFIMAIITLLVFLTFLFSLIYKISAHSVGMGGTLGLLIALNSLAPENYLLPLLVMYIVVAGAVMSARLALNAHTTEEVYSGFVLGFAFSVTVWMVGG